jgi:tetratricopeptide (TPR) repeat protein
VTDQGQAIGRAFQLYREGDLAGARAEAEALLAGDGDSPALLQLLAMLCCRSGDMANGAAYFRRALALEPGSATIRLGLANALVALGELKEAERLCGEDEAPGPALRRLHGYVLQALGRPAEAARCYEHAVEAEPRDWEIWNNLGNARREAGDLAGAVAALEKARSLRPDLAAIHYNLGVSLAASGRLDEGVQALAEAVRLGPETPAALIELGKALRHLGRHDEALPVLERASELAPDHIELRLEIGRALAGLRRFDEAERAYRAALAIGPGLAQAYRERGLLLERGNRTERLPALLAEAEEQGVAADELSYLRAVALDREGKVEEALAEAQRAPEDEEPARRAALIGRLADKAGDTETAFAAYLELNRRTAEENPRARDEAAAYRLRIEALTRMLSDEYGAAWRPLPRGPGGRPSPIFLVGFPRSGTTLLDTMLMGHSDTHVLEEEPILQRVGEALGDFARLPGLGAEETERLRALYFAELDSVDAAASGKAVVDKLPLNIVGAPLIHRLFPDAKFILALRHPCDVVLSCFMQNFELNDAMASFLDLGDSARLYDLVLGYWERSRALFPLDVHVVRYEDLVDDPEAQLRSLLEHLGLPWDEKVLDHVATARKRAPIITPSYAQVAERIYKRASGRWERYRPQMEEVLPVLLPWAERLGYGASRQE